VPSIAPSLGAGGKESLPVPKKTKTDANDMALTLIWNQQKYQWTIPNHPLTNTPSFHTNPASRTYRAFVALFEAAKARYHQWEHVLQIPGWEKFHANIPKKPITDSEGATRDDLTVQASNLLSGKGDKEEKETTRMGPLTFDVNHMLEKDKHVYLDVVDNQAKLMHWHYRLGHLSFTKLKQLALNGEIPWRLVKVNSLLPAQDASLAAWPKYPGEDKRPPQKCSWQQNGGNVSVWINLYQCK
jgi:hypothetical protein